MVVTARRGPKIRNITVTPEILKHIAEIDEFKGRWTVIETLAPEKLTSLRRIAAIESMGSSTRIDWHRSQLKCAPGTMMFGSRDGTPAGL
jgi:hypothetical protein